VRRRAKNFFIVLESKAQFSTNTAILQIGLTILAAESFDGRQRPVLAACGGLVPLKRRFIRRRARRGAEPQRKHVGRVFNSNRSYCIDLLRKREGEPSGTGKNQHLL
jgi:hypothetical protein